MADSGWIKIHRKILNAPYYKDSEYVHLWVHLIICAWHRESKYLDGNKIIVLKPGQFLTGRKRLSKETGIQESKIERILNVFENEHQIEQVSTRRNRLVSIVSWDKYQKIEQQDEQQKNNERTTDEQRMNTKEELKNKKNGKNVREAVRPPTHTMGKREKEFYDSLAEHVKTYGKEMVRKFYDYWREPNKSKTRMKFEMEPTWDISLRLKKWEGNTFSKNGINQQEEPKGPPLTTLNSV